MNEYEFDLSVGDVVCFGDRTVTVVDIDGPTVSFRIDRDDDLVTVESGGARAAAITLHETD